MSDISKQIGERIRGFRKKKGISISQLANAIHKSKATVYKYENGDIPIDVNTLYDIVGELGIHVMQLLSQTNKADIVTAEPKQPMSFFDGDRYYAYFFDGRINKIISCVVDFMLDSESNKKVALYMNCSDSKNYMQCEHTYYGNFAKHDIVSHFYLVNQETSVERITITILSSYKNCAELYGLMHALSNRPFMPIAVKMLFAKTPLKVDDELNKRLRISADDVRTMKKYNMLTVIN